MDERIHIAKRRLGVNFNLQGLAELLIWAPAADTLSIVIDGIEPLMLAKGPYGYWEGTTDRLKKGGLYMVRLDGKRDLPDPYSLAQPEGVHGPSEAIDLSFSWTDDLWNNIPLGDYIIYELHTGVFSKEGNFEGIIQRLDYLKDLGITAIEIMPVAQFPGTRNWGYDGVCLFAVQNSYGGAKGLQRLVDACHQKGLAVILDVVYNHVGPEGNYLNEFGPYFTDKYRTPWGKALNFDDAGCDGVRHFFMENALMWLRDFHIDALRMDAVHAIKDLSPVHILREIGEQVNELKEMTGRDYYLIAECDLNDPRFIDPPERGGYGLDAQWADEFHHALRVVAGEERKGYYADFEGIPDLAKAYRDAYVYDGQYSRHRQRRFGAKTSNPGRQFVVFSQNHDQAGNRMQGERTSHLASFEMQKLLAGAVLVSPYLPLLFMGEELSAPHPFLYFISHTDKELVEAVRQGRKAEFAAFHDKDETLDPQAEQSFNESKLEWSLLQEEPHRTMLDYYCALIKLRKQSSVLRHPDRQHLEVLYEEKQQVLFLHRWRGTLQVICLMNFSDTVQNTVMPFYKQQWNLSFNSAAERWKGRALVASSLADGDGLQLPPESLLIYTNERAHV